MDHKPHVGFVLKHTKEIYHAIDVLKDNNIPVADFCNDRGWVFVKREDAQLTRAILNGYQIFIEATL